MKKLLAIFVLLLLSEFVSANSDTLTIYYNAIWGTTNKSNAVYYRKSFENSNDIWIVNDYYADGDIIQMSGSYLDKRFKTKAGVFIYYFPNGNKQSEGPYVNNNQSGEWTNWYDNGKIKDKGSFDENGKKEGAWSEWYKSGGIKCEGSYKEDKEVGLWTFYYRNGEKSSYGNFINGKKDGLWDAWHSNKTQDSKGIYEVGKMQGEWNWYFNNGQKRSSEKYLNDSLLSVAFWDTTGKSISTKGITKTQIMPVFNGGDNELFKFLSTHIKYPEKAKDNGISGTVYLKFVIDEDGFVEEPEVIQSPHYLLSYEATRVLMDMPKWTPGNSHNLPVKVFYNIPIKFTLK